MSKSGARVNLLDHTVSAAGFFEQGGVLGAGGWSNSKGKETEKIKEVENAGNLATVQVRQRTSLFAPHVKVYQQPFHTSLVSSSFVSVYDIFHF